MIRIPEDLEIALQKKYPDTYIKAIIQNLFQMIFEKTLKDGSCHIREFGKFVAFKTNSVRIGREVIRFKFKISPSLENKIKIDEFLLTNIPVKATVPFTEKHEEICKDKKDIRDANVKAFHESAAIGAENTKKQIVLEEVNSILNNLDE